MTFVWKVVDKHGHNCNPNMVAIVDFKVDLAFPNCFSEPSLSFSWNHHSKLPCFFFIVIFSILLYSCMVSIFMFAGQRTPHNSSLKDRSRVKLLQKYIGRLVDALRYFYFDFHFQAKLNWCIVVLWKLIFVYYFASFLTHLKEWIECKRLLCMVLHGCIRVSEWIWDKLWPILRWFQWSKLKEAT